MKRVFGLVIAQRAGWEGEVIDEQSVSEFASFAALCLQTSTDVAAHPGPGRQVWVWVRSNRTGSPPALQGFWGVETTLGLIYLVFVFAVVNFGWFLLLQQRPECVLGRIWPVTTEQRQNVVVSWKQMWKKNMNWPSIDSRDGQLTEPMRCLTAVCHFQDVDSECKLKKLPYFQH